VEHGFAHDGRGAIDKLECRRIPLSAFPWIFAPVGGADEAAYAAAKILNGCNQLPTPDFP